MNIKSSYYNFLFENNNKFYVYNILTTAIAELEQDIFNNLQNNKIEVIIPEIRQSLLEQGFLVPIETDEKNYYKYFYDNARFCYSSKSANVTLIPTYDCNLSCPYCYEGKEKNKEKISIQDIDKILKFISSKTEKNNDDIPIQTLHIMIYGGEPLLCKDSLLYFCEKTFEIAEKQKIKIDYHITTNLTLLDTSVIEIIAKYQISLQVSIDGTKEEHNKRRIYSDGTGTYDIIIKNLKRLVDNGLKHLITIRINIDEENSECAEDIFTDLKEYSDDIYFGILKSYKGINDKYSQNCFENCCLDNLSTNKIHDIYENNDLPIPLKFGKKSPCSINAQNRYFIDNKLDVYKCDLLVNHPECRIGYIDNNGKLIKEPNFYQQMSFSPFLFKECEECKLLPLCGAGCPAEIYLAKQLKNGDIIHKNCTYTEESLKNYLLDYIKRL